jgi:hypothetical protein
MSHFSRDNPAIRASEELMTGIAMKANIRIIINVHYRQRAWCFNNDPRHSVLLKLIIADGSPAEDASIKITSFPRIDEICGEVSGKERKGPFSFRIQCFQLQSN